jgi:uncharacterized membrane protein YkoI
MPQKKVVAALAVAAAAAITGGAIAVASNDSDANVTGPQAERATAAALEATHGGTANSVELDGENGAKWEVEITKTDGTTVDVRLDEAYKVVVIEGDSETSDEGGSE